MTPRRQYTLDQAAACAGLSGERFRKVWKWWVRERAFPHPLKYPELVRGRWKRDPYAWDAEACEAWCAKASTQAVRPPPTSSADNHFPANDRHPLDGPPSAVPPGLARRVAADRAALSSLMRQQR